MNIELLGPRGVGKTTLAKRLEKDLDIPYVSLGDLTRREMAADTLYGRAMEAYIKTGGYPEGFLVPLVEETFNQNPNGIIFDGFPRQVSEAQDLVSILGRVGTNLDLIVRLEAPLESIQERVAKRLICSACGMQGHKLENFCCSQFLGKRPDDNPEIVEKYYLLYQKTIASIMSILTADTYARCIELNGEQQPSVLVQAIIHQLGEATS